MPAIPHDTGPDSTLAFRRDPYRFIARRCRQLGADVFQTRLLLRKTLCMSGPEAAAVFYDHSYFRRRGASPGRVQRTLFGKGGVQGLDGDTHRHRKAMFMALMTPENLDRLLAETEAAWADAVDQWPEDEAVSLYDQCHGLLTRAVCAWAGVPLPEAEVDRRTHELTTLFDNAGDVGPSHWRARFDRKRANAWIEGVIKQIRAGEHLPDEHAAAHVMAHHRDEAGNLLPARIAAVELLNVLRPVVAVSVYITFVAHALEMHPEVRAGLVDGGDEQRAAFAQEVRRFYPFFPAVVAVTREAFTWHDYAFPPNTRVLLDLYGTNHDPRTWTDPETFRPARFLETKPGPYEFVPQGGGDHHIQHRCPGEAITSRLMEQAADLLVHRLDYEVPEQDMEVDYQRLPALPRDGLLLRRVRWRA